MAFDGSLSTIEDPSITAVKIASYRKDLTAKPVYVNGILDPSSLNVGVESVASVGLLPGKGIYSADGAGSWDTKFREEFYQNLRHLQTHGSTRRRSLLQYFREAFDREATEKFLLCPNCAKERIDFEDNAVESVCPLCGASVWFSDFLAKALFAAQETPTQPMLLMERLMLHSVLEEAANNTLEYDGENTLFIADGSLQIFGLPEVAGVLLSKLQKYEKTPALVSFMKSGRVQELLQLNGMEDVLKPGHVMMVTSEAWKMLFKTRGEAGIYGKAFAYRTLDGKKSFSFMLPPAWGDPVENAPVMNSWSNYPHVAAVCEFIEANQSNENGPNVATLEVIAGANYAASLPAQLARRTLEEIVHEIL